MHNLFKSKQIDQECRYINEKCLQECVCIKTKDNNITKDFFNSELFYWECNIYLALCEKGFIPFFYHTHNSLKMYLYQMIISYLIFLTLKLYLVLMISMFFYIL